MNTVPLGRRLAVTLVVPLLFGIAPHFLPAPGVDVAWLFARARGTTHRAPVLAFDSTRDRIVGPRRSELR